MTLGRLLYAPSSTSPQPHLTPVSRMGRVELVWTWLVTWAPKRSTRRTQDPSRRNTTGPVGSPGLTSTASHHPTLPPASLSILPGDARVLCPLCLPLPHWI